MFTMFTGQVDARVIKIATLSPDGTMWMRVMREGAKDVAKQTNNKVRIKFYPGGVMGNDAAVLRKIRIGQLHGGAFVSGSLSKFYPGNQVYNLPLIFKTYKEVDYVRKRMDPIILGGLEQNGFVSFGLAEGGFAYLMSQKPVRSMEDLREQKVWIPDNDQTSLETLKTFDVSPVPLSLADVRTALQTGLIDTVTISPVGALALQWHTQVDYLTHIPLLYVYGMLAVDRKAFLKFSPENRTVLRDIMGKAFQRIDRQNRVDNDKALEALKRQGIQFIRPSMEALSRWQTTASNVTQRLIRSGKLSKDIIDILKGHLSEFRSKKLSSR
jgi:TRAP-type C4-dicarboxylate transport system substrate-binding protein